MVSDKVIFGAGIVQAETVFSRSSNNLVIAISGTTDSLVIQNWYLGSPYQVELFQYADGSSTTPSQVAGLVSAMASFDAPQAAMITASPMMRSTQWRQSGHPTALF